MWLCRCVIAQRSSLDPIIRKFGDVWIYFQNLDAYSKEPAAETLLPMHCKTSTFTIFSKIQKSLRNISRLTVPSSEIP